MTPSRRVTWQASSRAATSKGLRRRGGNITGLYYRQPELAVKQLELLLEAFPERIRVAVLSYSGYLVPTNADIPELDILLVGEFDEEASPLGSKGLGELTAVSVAPAIANPIYHATGKRVRDLRGHHGEAVMTRQRLKPHQRHGNEFISSCVNAGRRRLNGR
jgi:hypothetical protein